MRSADKLTRLYPTIVGVNSLELSKAAVGGDRPLVAECSCPFKRLSVCFPELEDPMAWMSLSTPPNV